MSPGPLGKLVTPPGYPTGSMKLRTLVFTFISLWLISAVAVPFFAGSLDRANNFGGSFGAVSALFSGFALALAIWSMLQQQRQSSEFERATLATLARQAEAIKLIEQTLIAQANTAQVTALATLIDREERQVENLLQWGRMVNDEHRYANGIKAAQQRIKDYQAKLRHYVSDKPSAGAGVP